MKKTDKTCMFNLTNVGLNICVKEYSDLFLNFMIEYAFKRANCGIYVPYKGITRMAGKMIIIPMWWEKFGKISAWQEKFIQRTYPV